MAYQPIENYGIVGDLHTVALVAKDGSIDWFCFPHFDSPSVFAALLDDTKGGRFRLAPTQQGTRRKQFYWPETNVLITGFLTSEGVGQITDFMPLGLRSTDPRWHQLIRRVQVFRGSMEFRMDCRPASNYARDSHETMRCDGGVAFRASDLAIRLATRQPLSIDGTGVRSQFTLHEGQSPVFELGRLDGD